MGWAFASGVLVGAAGGVLGLLFWIGSPFKDWAR